MQTTFVFDNTSVNTTDQIKGALTARLARNLFLSVASECPGYIVQGNRIFRCWPDGRVAKVVNLWNTTPLAFAINDVQFRTANADKIAAVEAIWRERLYGQH